MNKVEKLLEKCEGEVNKPWFNWKFLLYILIEEFKPQEIRKIFNNFLDLDETEVETFTDICDSRITRAKSFLMHIVTGLSLLIASLAVIASILVRSESEREESKA